MGVHRIPADTQYDRVVALQTSSLDPAQPSPGNLLGSKVGSPFLWTPVTLADLGLGKIVQVQPHQFVPWTATGASLAIDVDTWSTTAVPWATVQTIFGGLSVNFGDTLATDAEFQIRSATGGLGTLVASASIRNTTASGNARLSMAFGPQAMLPVAANASQSYTLRCVIRTTAPVTGITLDGQGTATSCGVLILPA